MLDEVRLNLEILTFDPLIIVQWTIQGWLYWTRRKSSLVYKGFKSLIYKIGSNFSCNILQDF